MDRTATLRFWVLPALTFSVSCVYDYTIYTSQLSTMHIWEGLHVYVFYTAAM